MYDAAELVELPAEVLAVIAEVRSATRADSEGGKKISRGERKKLVKAVLHLAFLLARDGLD
jgi:hypothetical protein